MVHAVYDNIAVEYKDSKQLPFRKCIETYSLFKMAGNIKGLKILDLACGEGFYTRKLKLGGASEVVGVDISAEMISLAQQNEFEMPTGCEYLVKDVAELPYIDSFDMVVAMYLLNYAKSKKELVAFCEAAAQQLESGGRFIGFNDNVANDPGKYRTYRKYGFTKQCANNRLEGDPIRYTFYNMDGTNFQFNNYYLSPDTYKAAFTEAGFVDFQWVKPYLLPAQKDNGFWDAFLEHPPIIGFKARKA